MIGCGSSGYRADSSSGHLDQTAQGHAPGHCGLKDGETDPFSSWTRGGEQPGEDSEEHRAQGGRMVGEPEVVAPPAAQIVEREPDQLVCEIVDSARESLGLNRKELAKKLRVHPRTLRNWMQCPSGLTAEQIERLSVALSLSAENKTNLRFLTGQRLSTPTVNELKDLPEMAVYRRLIDSCSSPSIVTDYIADNIIWNAAFQDIFGGETPHRFAHPMQSGLRYILFHPRAHHLLGGGDVEAFRHFWLMPALANLTRASEQLPGDEKLLLIEQEIQRRPKLRRAYEATPAWIFKYGDIHTNSSARPFRDPRTGELTTVHVVTEGHRGYQPVMLTHTTFVFEDAPPCGNALPGRGAPTGVP